MWPFFKFPCIGLTLVFNLNLDRDTIPPGGLDNILKCPICKKDYTMEGKKMS